MDFLFAKNLPDQQSPFVRDCECQCRRSTSKSSATFGCFTKPWYSSWCSADLRHWYTQYKTHGDNFSILWISQSLDPSVRHNVRCGSPLSIHAGLCNWSAVVFRQYNLCELSSPTWCCECNWSYNWEAVFTESNHESIIQQTPFVNFQCSASLR